MTKQVNLEKSIEAIGLRLVACSQPCAGIHRDQRVGSLPRCLFLESHKRQASRGAAIIGINPGRATKQEQAFYRERGGTYSAVKEWFADLGFRHPYYVRLRGLADQLELAGPLLWTELAKCENASDQSGLPPLPTLRRCTGLFLRAELALLPPNWPLIAVGGEAYKALAYLHPERTIIGVPHPTGSYGHFARLFATGSLITSVKNTAINALHSPIGQIIWLQSVSAA